MHGEEDAAVGGDGDVADRLFVRHDRLQSGDRQQCRRGIESVGLAVTVGDAEIDRDGEGNEQQKDENVAEIPTHQRTPQHPKLCPP